jgi:hypothetical protein
LAGAALVGAWPELVASGLAGGWPEPAALGRAWLELAWPELVNAIHEKKRKKINE